jgi:hypothetical protein
MARRQLGAPPASANDLLSMQDLFVVPTPVIGQIQVPYTQMGSGTATAFAAGNSGNVTFSPIIINKAMSYDRIGVGTTVAQSGGTTSCILGIYPSLTDLSGPDCSAGPIVSGTVTLTAAAGNQLATIAWSPTVPGLYWLACLYRETVAPTTRATINMITNSSPAWALPSGSTIGQTPNRYIIATAQTALPTSQPTLAGGNSTLAPVVGIRRSA